MADLTTLLSKFLNDLYAGTLGVTMPISKVLVGDGSAAAPSLSFSGTGGTDDGIFRPGDNAVDIATAGITAARFTQTGIFTNSLVFDVVNQDVSLFRGAADVLTTSDRFLSTGPVAGIGYGTGAGGTVTQLTSKSTGVTLNTVTGNITMNGAALAAGATVSFTLTSSAIVATDYIMVQHISGGTVGAYTVQADGASGSALISITNRSAGSLSEAIILKFVVFKAAIS